MGKESSTRWLFSLPFYFCINIDAVNCVSTYIRSIYLTRSVTSLANLFYKYNIDGRIKVRFFATRYVMVFLVYKT